MREHLTTEQIAAMLDEPQSVPGGKAHLDTCEACAADFEAMSRTRMALSGLPDLEPPAGEWERIRARLPEADTVVLPVRLSGPRAWLARMSNPMVAAAVLMLFAAGLLVGRALTPDRSGFASPDAARVADADAAGEVDATPAGGSLASIVPAGTEAEFPEYFNTVQSLQALREQGFAEIGPGADPAVVAERLTRLDALIDASREALRDAPADPALNNFLFDMYDERSSLSGQLDQSLRQASMEY